MSGARKTQAYLEVRYPGEPDYLIDEIAEFSYSSSVVTIGDVCTFTVVAAEDGTTLQQLRQGAHCRLKMSNPSVNGGNWTVKHSGRIVSTDSDELAGTISVQVADLGWHLQYCHGPLYMPLRGVSIERMFDPGAPDAFIDPSFGFKGARIGLDANRLNRNVKQGRAGFAPPVSVLAPPPLIQVNEGESYHSVLTRYAQRENLLLNVSCDDYIQLWNPDYARAPLYHFASHGPDANVKNVRRHDSAQTRYTEVYCAGEVLPSLIKQDSTIPNVNKRVGRYPARSSTTAYRPLPFRHRQTRGDSEMLDDVMSAAEAQWLWKQGLYQSHYLEVTAVDHYQGAAWFEADQLCTVDFPRSRAKGIYYVESVSCDATEQGGDETRLILRLPWLLSAAYGEWGTRPRYADPQIQELYNLGGGA